MALGAALPACQDDPPGIIIELLVKDPKYRPDFVRFHWLRPGRRPFEERLPESGAFTGAAELLGSMFIETAGPLQEARALAVRGYRGDRQISGGWLPIRADKARQRRLQLELGDPLGDEDANGVPDLVDGNCVDGSDTITTPPCKPAPSEGNGSAPMPDGGAPLDPEAPDAAPLPVQAEAGAPAEPGLLGEWRFDEGAGRNAADSSGVGNHATVRGNEVTWEEGRRGRAITIATEEGSGVTVSPSASVNRIRDAFTISAWIRRSEDRERLSQVVSRRSVGSGEHFALSISTNGLPRLYLNTHLSSPPPAVTGPDPLPLDVWIHLAATYDGAQQRLYVNGSQVAELAATTTIMADKTLLCLGCGQNNDTTLIEPLGGLLDDVRLYDRALTAAEIAALAR